MAVSKRLAVSHVFARQFAVVWKRCRDAPIPARLFPSTQPKCNFQLALIFLSHNPSKPHLPQITSKMKLIVDGEYFVANGLILTDPDDRPEEYSNWDTEFGSGDGVLEKVELHHLMTPVEDQKRIGSCTANAVAGAYEYLCNVRAKQTSDEPGDISHLFGKLPF